MSQQKTVPWTEVESAAIKAFDVWCDGSELEWAKQAWEYLAQAGLTSYSNEGERCQVLVRLLTLGTMYRTFCDVAWDERWESDTCEYESWYTALHLDAFRIGGMVGQEFFYDEDVDESSEEFDLILRGIFVLVDQALPKVFIALKHGFGGEVKLYESLCHTNSYLADDWEGTGTEPRRYNEPSNPMALFSWVADGCQSFR